MNIRLSENDRIQVTAPADIFGIMQRILLRENKIDREKEHFWIVGLDPSGVILYIELISMGSAWATVVEPTNVFRVAVMKNAATVIAVHNHPSGSLKISSSDEELTDRLVQAGSILKVNVVDHLIISLDKFVSLREAGILDKLASSTKYLPKFILEEKIREEEKQKMIASLLKNGFTSMQIADILNIKQP